MLKQHRINFIHLHIESETLWYYVPFTLIHTQTNLKQLLKEILSMEY